MWGERVFKAYRNQWRSIPSAITPRAHKRQGPGNPLLHASFLRAPFLHTNFQYAPEPLPPVASPSLINICREHARANSTQRQTGATCRVVGAALHVCEGYLLALAIHEKGYHRIRVHLRPRVIVHIQKVFHAIPPLNPVTAPHVCVCACVCAVCVCVCTRVRMLHSRNTE